MTAADRLIIALTYVAQAAAFIGLVAGVHKLTGGDQ